MRIFRSLSVPRFFPFVFRRIAKNYKLQKPFQLPPPICKNVKTKAVRHPDFSLRFFAGSPKRGKGWFWREKKFYGK